MRANSWLLGLDVTDALWYLNHPVTQLHHTCIAWQKTEFGAKKREGQQWYVVRSAARETDKITNII